MKGFWPNPETEAFRRPVRSLYKDHLYPRGERDLCLLKNQDVLVNNFLRRGKPDYFVGEGASPYFNVSECTNFAHKNHYDLLNNNYDLNDIIDVNAIDDFNDVYGINRGRL